MDLSIYAIKVGKTSLDMLNINKELGTDFSIVNKDNPEYIEKADKSENDDKNTNTILNVFDVLLAGVEVNDR